MIMTDISELRGFAELFLVEKNSIIERLATDRNHNNDAIIAWLSKNAKKMSGKLYGLWSNLSQNTTRRSEWNLQRIFLTTTQVCS